MPETTPPEQPWSYARPLPPGVRVLTAGVMALGMLCLPVATLVGTQVWIRLTLGRAPALQGAVDALPFGEGALIGSLVGFAVLPLIAAIFVVPGWLRRRYGRVEVHGDQLVFHFAFAPSWGKQTVLAEHVTGRTPTRHGLQLYVLDRWPPADLLFPLLVPTTDDAEQARLLAHLDAAAPQPDAAPEVFGRLPSRWVLGGGALAMLPLCLSLAVLFVRFDEPALLGVGLAGILPLVAVTVYVDTRGVQPHFRKLHLGQEALLLANRRIPYDELEWVGTTGDVLALQAGKHRLRVHLRDELPAALELLRARLAAREAPLAIEAITRGWAAPEGLRRRLALALALGAAWWVASLGAAFSDPELYDDAYVVDDDDQYVRVIFRVTDRVPRLVSLLESPADASESYFLDDQLVLPGLWIQTFGRPPETVRLDLVAGRGRHPHAGAFAVDPATRWHLITAEGHLHTSRAPLPAALTDTVIAAYDKALHHPSLPALLEPALADVDDPAIQAWLAGETSRRTYDVRDDAGQRLLWAVRHGEPVWAVVAPADRPLRIYLSGMVHEDETQGLPTDLDEPGFYWFDSGAPLALGACPPIDALRAAQRAVEQGTPVREALAELAAPRLRALAADDAQ